MAVIVIVILLRFLIIFNRLYSFIVLLQCFLTSSNIDLLYLMHIFNYIVVFSWAYVLVMCLVCCLSSCDASDRFSNKDVHYCISMAQHYYNLLTNTNSYITTTVDEWRIITNANKTTYNTNITQN